MSQRARKLKQQALGGGELYEIGDNDKIWLVVKRRWQGAAVVTVLPAGASSEDIDGAEEYRDPMADEDPMYADAGEPTEGGDPEER